MRIQSNLRSRQNIIARTKTKSVFRKIDKDGLHWRITKVGSQIIEKVQVKPNNVIQRDSFDKKMKKKGFEKVNGHWQLKKGTK